VVIFFTLDFNTTCHNLKSEQFSVSKWYWKLQYYFKKLSAKMKASIKVLCGRISNITNCVFQNGLNNPGKTPLVAYMYR